MSTTITNEEILGNLVRSSAIGDFRPCAVFDEHLDCIRVVTKDCSTTEIRVNGLLTVLEDNYPVSDTDQLVGFTIKGARHFCQENGFSLSTPIKVAAILDVIMAKSPDPVVRLIVQRVAKPLLSKEPINDVELQLAQTA